MSRPNLRQKPRISYYEPEEPNLDEYIFCDKCGDYVYEYCSIHGPLLVIPDDKVPSKPQFPAYVPRAALTVPRVFLHLAPSIIPDAGLGVFSTLTLPRGVRFGPYRGQRSMAADSTYCWQIYDRNNKPCHVVDAADPDRSNWMRYVNCARHWREQNLVAFQYQGQLYYRTIKIIPRFTELMVFYGSEFARSLNIDLRRYNSPAGYAPTYKPTNKRDSHFKCHECAYSTVSGDTLDRHKKLHDKARPHQCDVCGYRFNAKTDLQMHKRRQHAIDKLSYKIHSCNIYSYKTDCRGSSKSHERTHTGDKPFSCTFCKYKCTESSDLKKHERTYTGDKPYSCTFCKYKCTVSSALKAHERTHTGDKPYSCTFCKYKCTTSSALKAHERTHTGDKPYSCTFCKYKCTTSSALKAHERTHTGDKPYSCTFCKYKCTQSSALKAHERTHTGDKRYSCTFCKYKCTQSSHLKAHERTHTGDKPYSCTFCKYKCTTSSALKAHERTHTGDKPYSCTFCKYKCTQSSALKAHERTHTGDKRYSCTFCKYKCTQSSHLKAHERTHTGDKPYSCSFCEYKSATTRTLKIHERTHTG